MELVKLLNKDDRVNRYVHSDGVFFKNGREISFLKLLQFAYETGRHDGQFRPSEEGPYPGREV